jgi:hypothetical protein
VAETREDFEAAKAKALLLVDVLSGLGPGSVVDVVDACTRLSLDVLGLAKFAYDFGVGVHPVQGVVVEDRLPADIVNCLWQGLPGYYPTLDGLESGRTEALHFMQIMHAHYSVPLLCRQLRLPRT